MSNPGMDPEIFEQFIDQLRRYVRERLIPPKKMLSPTTPSPTISSPKCAKWACSASLSLRNLAAPG